MSTFMAYVSQCILPPQFAHVEPPLASGLRGCEHSRRVIAKMLMYRAQLFPDLDSIAILVPRRDSSCVSAGSFVVAEGFSEAMVSCRLPPDLMFIGREQSNFPTDVFQALENSSLI